MKHYTSKRMDLTKVPCGLVDGRAVDLGAFAGDARVIRHLGYAAVEDEGKRDDNGDDQGSGER